ncbi:hypothetical protein N2152v2_007098 [Parachlorella kessleri]
MLLALAPPSSQSRGVLRPQEPGSTVLVAGATGGVGQLLTAKLLERGYQVKALSRSREKVQQLLGEAPGLEVVIADLRDPSSLPAAVEGCAAVCCCTGTTAFPSKRWDGGNGPEQTDFVSVRNLIQACSPSSVKRFVLTTSAGVQRYNQLPFSILNLFGVLKYKRRGEQELEQSGLTYTIMRPNRLTDGPYTSYDLNTLLKGTAGVRQDVQLSLKDDLQGETSRIAVAEAIVQSLMLEAAENHAFALTSSTGSGPGQDPAKWKQLFESLLPARV